MTTEEIKNLIASAVAGQGNQVDAGGKLADILNGIVGAIEGGVKPIVLSSAPPTGASVAQAALDAIGLTRDEIMAAAKGLRSGIVIESYCYVITEARYSPTGIWSLEFAYYEITSSGAFYLVRGYKLSGNTTGAQVTKIDYEDI